MSPKLTKKFFQEQGRLGGQKASAKRSKAQKQATASSAGKAAWVDLTPEQRSAEMKRRAVVRTENAKKKARAEARANKRTK